MVEIATSRPFRITLPSGTPLYGITRTEYLVNNGTVSPAKTETPSGTIQGSRVSYYTETTSSDYEKIPEEQRLRYSDPTGGVGGSPKYYKLVGVYNSTYGNEKKWSPTSQTGADLENEIASYNAGRRNQMSTVLATAPIAVSIAERIPSAGLSGRLGLTNTPSTPPPPPQTRPGGGDPPPPPPDQPSTRPVTGIPDNPTEQTVGYRFAPSGGLRYPEKLNGQLNSKDKQDVIKFTAVKIKPRSTPAQSEEYNLQFVPGGELNNDSFESVDSPVIIAIQSPISDQNSAEWGGDNVNPLEAAVFGLATNLIKQPGSTYESVATELQNFMSSMYAVAKGEQSRIQTYLAGLAANINNVLARTDGVILNPNLELLFNGPQLRPFTFTFKMAARSDDEAKIIKQIINYFKYHMAPRKESPAVFLKAPHVFNIEYLYNGYDVDENKNTLHPGLNKIKTCALTNISVDYTPLGSYMTYPDGTMVAYTLNMQFQELTPVYDTDYSGYQIGGENNARIGY